MLNEHIQMESGSQAKVKFSDNPCRNHTTRMYGFQGSMTARPSRGPSLFSYLTNFETII